MENGAEGVLSPPPTPVPQIHHRPSHFHAHSHSPFHASTTAHSSHQPSRTDSEAKPNDGLSSQNEHISEKPRQHDTEETSSLPPRHTRSRSLIRRVSSSHRPKAISKQSASKKISTQTGKQERFVKRFRKSRYYPALVLENSGSTARDHLASERTFLAYVRTSLALASMGVALVQLFAIADITKVATPIEPSPTSRIVRNFARPLGATTIAFALLMLLIGLWRYFKVQVSLVQGVFPTARISVVFTGFVLGAIVTIIFGVVLSGRN